MDWSATVKDWSVTVTINAHHINFKMMLALSATSYPIPSSNVSTNAFGGHRLNSLGKATLHCEYKHKFCPVNFEVLDNASIGLKISSEMKLMQHIEALESDLLTKYIDTFTGLGWGHSSYSAWSKPQTMWSTHPARFQWLYGQRWKKSWKGWNAWMSLNVSKNQPRAQERKLKLNKYKSQIKKMHISNISHNNYRRRWYQAWPQKLTAVVEIKSLACKDELQHFLSMPTYLSKFIENYSNMSAPLRVLLEKDTEWHWTDRQDTAIQQASQMHPCWSSSIQVNRPRSLLMQVRREWMQSYFQNLSPIAYASKSLTAT